MDYSALYSRAATIGRAQGGSQTQPPIDDVISLSFGMPDPGSFPVDELRAATDAVLAHSSATALQYGPAQGDPRLRRYIADRLNEQEGLALTPREVAVTSGSSQAIDLLARLLVDPGDIVLLEGPTFLGAVRTFSLFRSRLEEVPVDEGGLVVAALQERLEQLAAEGARPKFLYTLPTFHNPTGVTMPLERRVRLLEVAREHGLLVVEDDPYGDLRYEGSSVPSLQSLDRDGLVVRLGSFSKILAAGVRLGWAAGPTELIESLPAVKTDTGSSPYAAALTAEWAESGKLEPHVERLRTIYRERRDAMLAGLERFCAPYCTWTRPQGGFFIWVTLNPEVDPTRFQQAAREQGVTYLGGQACFASGRGADCLRLSFSYLPPDRIMPGIERLGRAMEAAKA